MIDESPSAVLQRQWRPGQSFGVLTSHLIIRGQNSSAGSVLGSLSCVMQRYEFDFFLRTDFSLGASMGSDSIPQSSFGWEYKLRSSLCTHAVHRTDSKYPGIHVLDRCIPATKTHSACTIHEDRMWLPQWSHTQKSHQNGEPQRYGWGTQKKNNLITQKITWVTFAFGISVLKGLLQWILNKCWARIWFSIFNFW